MHQFTVFLYNNIVLQLLDTDFNVFSLLVTKEVTKEAKLSKFFEKENWNFVDDVAELYAVQLISVYTNVANKTSSSIFIWINFYVRKEIT